MAAAAKSFHCFPQLPKELRKAIWRECLPRRVLELDVPRADLLAQDLPDELEGTVSCRLEDTTSLNSKPPVIAQVCFEAREVAFETGRLIDFRDLWDGASVNVHGTAGPRYACWFDPACDAIHLHWNPLYEVEWMTTCDDPIPALLSLGAEAARGASLTWDGANSYDNTMTLLKQAGQSYMLCLSQLVSIHASHEDAVQSGLFGLLGEERVVLVDAGDDSRIRLFDDFNRVYGSSQDCQTAHFFQKWRTSGADFPKHEMQECQKDWLMSQSVFATPRWEQTDLDAVWTFIPRENPESRSTWTPNWDHDWVKSVLEDIPPFQPVYMMRLCTAKCT